MIFSKDGMAIDTRDINLLLKREIDVLAVVHGCPVELQTSNPQQLFADLLKEMRKNGK